jgi:cell division protein FtsA
MSLFSLTLFLEINKSYLNFYVGKNTEDDFKYIYKLNAPIQGFENNRISDFELFLKIIKENIYLVEKKVDYIFKDIVLILENFHPTFINLTGYKRLNGSQISRENITYILNTLKSYVDQIEEKKTLLHIFNSKFDLDKKNIENLPIGLFGDFYSHELAFTLVRENDFKNLNNIFNNCNLKIRKIFLKSFLKGANLSDNILYKENFFHIKIEENDSKILYFENSCLKFEQDFKFGSDIIYKDISKITSLKIESIKKIIKKIDFNRELSNDDLIEKELFDDESYKKIRKKLIYDIAFARIREIIDIILFKNINFRHYIKSTRTVSIEMENDHFENFKEIFRSTLPKNSFDFKFLDILNTENMLKTANKLVQFGWKKEAIPITKTKRTIIARFFDLLFD